MFVSWPFSNLGSAVAGVYEYQIAEQKIYEVLEVISFRIFFLT